jgi:hypothetical protein
MREMKAYVYPRDNFHSKGIMNNCISDNKIRSFSIYLSGSRLIMVDT